MRKSLRIFILVFLSILLLILIWQVCERVFFTRNFIFSGNHYSFVDKYYNEEFKYEFNPQSYVFKNNECEINQYIAKRYDTSIVIDKLIISDNNIDFAIGCKTSWKYQGGVALTSFSYNGGGSSSSVMNHYKLLNSDGTEIPYKTVSTGGSNDISYISFDKNLLNNSSKLTLYIEGFNELKYTRISI
jgi:hypothetical protein